MQRKMTWIKPILPLLALSFLALFYWPDQPTFMPDKVWGTWKTTDPRYADRYLDISEAVFAIGQGEQRLQVFFFQRVDVKPDGRHERYTLYYRPDEKTGRPLQRFTFDFITTDEGPRIQLKHPKGIVWFRESDRHAVNPTRGLFKP
jgi:hypothetical protein